MGMTFRKLIVVGDVLRDVLIERVSSTECRTVEIVRERPATEREKKYAVEGFTWILDFDEPK
jgi:hypothetical protein